jgi:hypothetical protein
LLDTYQIPFSVVTDGKTAELLDTMTGQVLDEGMGAIPSKEQALEQIKTMSFEPFPADRVEKERIIFRSYDEMYVNVSRKLKSQ